MADSGPSRRHGWIPRVRVIPGNGLDSFGDFLRTRFRCILGEPSKSTANRSQGTLKLAQNSLEKLPDPTAVTPPGRRPKAAAREGRRTAGLVVFSREF